MPGTDASKKELRRQYTRINEGITAEQAAMTQVGFTPAMQEALNQAAQTFEAVDQSSIAAMGASKLGTQAYVAAVDAAFAFKVDLVASIRLAARKNPGVLKKMPLKSSSVRTGDDLAQWFNYILTTMGSLRAELAETSTVDWFAEVAAQQQTLIKAIGVHEQQIQSNAALEDERVAARNGLVDQIDNARAYAGVAFARQPNKLKLFSKGYGSKRASKASAAAGSSKSSGSSTAVAPSSTAPATAANPALASTPVASLPAASEASAPLPSPAATAGLSNATLSH